MQYDMEKQAADLVELLGKTTHRRHIHRAPGITVMNGVVVDSASKAVGNCNHTNCTAVFGVFDRRPTVRRRALLANAQTAR